MHNVFDAPPIAIGRVAYLASLALVIVGAAVSQYLLFRGGLYATCADESARSLMAARLSLANAFEPWIWPPFYKLFVGLVLKAFPDTFIVPRVLVFIAGLLTIVAVVSLSHRLFADRLVDIVAAVLSVFVPQRWLLGTTPLSEIYYYLAMLVVAGLLVSWLKDRDDRRLPAIALLFAVASTMRYEACFFSAVLMLYLFYRMVGARDLEPRVFLICGALVAAFPALWILSSLLHYGSLENLEITSWQFIKMYGRDYVYAATRNPATRLVADIAMAPALVVGVAGLGYLCVTDRTVRVWTALMFLPLLVITATMVLSLSINIGSPWRQTGVWVLLLLPFAARFLVGIASTISAGGWRYVALAVMIHACIVPSYLRSISIAREGKFDNGSNFTQFDRETGERMRALLGAGGRRALIDSVDNLAYLNVLVASRRPDRFVLTAGDDPLEVALYVPVRSAFLDADAKDVIEKYLTDRYDLIGGGDLARMRAEDIGYVLVRSERFADALERNPGLQRIDRFGPWTVFAVKDLQ